MLQVHHLNSRLFRITTSHMTGEPSFYHFSVTHTIFNSRQRKKAPRVTTSICSKLQSVSASLNKTFVHDSYSCCTPAAGLGHATHATSRVWRLRTPSLLAKPKTGPQTSMEYKFEFLHDYFRFRCFKRTFSNDESSITFMWKEAVSIVTCIRWLQLRSHAKLLQTVCVCDFYWKMNSPPTNARWDRKCRTNGHFSLYAFLFPQTTIFLPTSDKCRRPKLSRSKRNIWSHSPNQKQYSVNINLHAVSIASPLENARATSSPPFLRVLRLTMADGQPDPHGWHTAGCSGERGRTNHIHIQLVVSVSFHRLLG